MQCDLSHEVFPFEDLGLVTKDGDPIHLRFFRDIEGDRNRGFQQDMVLAFIGDEEVGYLKIGYMPRDRFDRTYPNIVSYLGTMKGWCGVRPHEQTAHETLMGLHQYAPNLTNLPWTITLDHLKALPEKEFKKLWRDTLRRLNKRFGEEFADFQRYYVDRPYVDFVRVYSGRRIGERVLPDNRITQPPTERCFQRQGIAVALYLASALWQQAHGLELRASGLQSDEAKAAWIKFDQMGLVETRHVEWLDGPKIERYLIVPEGFTPECQRGLTR
jgi:hypothetical protein